MTDTPPTAGPAAEDEPMDAALTRAVYAVDGVTDVFSPASVVGQLPQAVTAMVTGDADAINRVRISSSKAGTAIATRIAVDRGASSPETARSVADALLESSSADDGTTISVQVSRIS